MAAATFDYCSVWPNNNVLASWVFHFRFPKIPNAIFVSRVCGPYLGSQYPTPNTPLTIHEALEGGPHYPVSLKLF